MLASPRTHLRLALAHTPLTAGLEPIVNLARDELHYTAIGPSGRHPGFPGPAYSVHTVCEDLGPRDFGVVTDPVTTVLHTECSAHVLAYLTCP